MVRAGYVHVAIIHRTLTRTKGSITSTQMSMYATAHGGVRTLKESWLKVDSGKKIPCRSGELNLRQRHDGPMLHQLSCIPTPWHAGPRSSNKNHVQVCLALTEGGTEAYASKSNHRYALWRKKKWKARGHPPPPPHTHPCDYIYNMTFSPGIHLKKLKKSQYSTKVLNGCTIIYCRACCDKCRQYEAAMKTIKM